jgi:hypothetical protein
MAGLLIKELIIRGDLERCLVIAPGNLVEQWQDELKDKFDLTFDIVSRDQIETSDTGNPFVERSRLIMRLDMAARSETLQAKLQAAPDWDLVICDEAHRMAASLFGSEVKYTKRYKLGQLAGGRARHFMLMTATPHNGSDADFELFMGLLDADRFEGRPREDARKVDVSDLMRRLTKEELRKFDGSPLFPERKAYTTEERHKGTGFLRVHGAPDDPLGIEDAYEAALVLLPPSAWQRGRDPDTAAMTLAADIVEHRGPGQRRNRNRLAFLAPDQAELEDIQNVLRKKLAWASIVRDARGLLQLPPAQEDDAKKKLVEQETAALNAVRRGWKHLLLPQEVQPGSQNAARGFDLEAVVLSNRANDPDPRPNSPGRSARPMASSCPGSACSTTISAKSGSRTSRMWLSGSCAIGSHSSPTFQSCAIRRCSPRRLARPWRGRTRSTPSPIGSTMPRVSMSVCSSRGWSRSTSTRR